MKYEQVEEYANIFEKIGKFLWIRKDPIGSYRDENLCHELGGHVRFRQHPHGMAQYIARWAPIERRGYRQMNFTEFLAMQEHGYFPLRNNGD